MDLEKTLTVAAPRERVWKLMLDPPTMAGCVPGVESVEVLSDVEYLAVIKVKISFITARFKVKTTILEQRPPDYLRIEGTGEDTSVASSMKQTSELFLTDLGDGTTELRIRVHADVFGRLGSFGLSVMRTKADRMWDEFGANFTAIALSDGDGGADASARADTIVGAPVFAPVQDGVDSVAAPASAAPAGVPAVPGAPPASVAPARRVVTPPSSGTRPRKAGWWERLVGRSALASHAVAGEGGSVHAARLPTDIYVELHRADGLVKVLWPASAAGEAYRWLKDLK